MIKVGVVGLGKMGLSHLAMIRAHPDVEVIAVVDSSAYLTDVLSKYTGLTTHSDFDTMLDVTSELDAVIVATPTKLHSGMVLAALNRGVAVFCEKPLCLTPAESAELASLAESKGLVSQVGYHNRFVGAFSEVKRLLDVDAIGDVNHVLAEAYGPVVLKPLGSTWRSRRGEGGGCLYDYAAHPIDLLTWYVGAPEGVGGTVLGSVFSAETEDEVYSTLYFPNSVSGHISVNWSDPSCRKMSTKITIWGTKGRIFADRQECQVFLRDDSKIPEGYTPGWNTRYTTELSAPSWFYLRGEEYSAQLAYFVDRVIRNQPAGTNDFNSATVTDRVLELLRLDATKGPGTRNSLTAGNLVPATKLSSPSMVKRPWLTQGLSWLTQRLFRQSKVK